MPVPLKKLRCLLGGLAAVVAGLAAVPACATVYYQSIPDLTAVPTVNGYCSDCGSNSAIGQVFTPVASGVANYARFTISSIYTWPQSVNIGIFNDNGGAVGTSVFPVTTYSSFLSDIPTEYGTDVVTVALPGGVQLNAGATYDAFIWAANFQGSQFFGLPGYSPGLGIVAPLVGGSPEGAAYSSEGVGRNLGLEFFAPGPTLGTGLLSLAFFVLAGGWAKARGFMAR
jgi:hypothetical protein